MNKEAIISAGVKTDDAKLTDDMSEYVSGFIDRRWPPGAFDGTPELRVVISEVILDAFMDGANWAEQAMAKTGESKLIKIGGR